jgi:hypothetical protein
MVSCHLVAAIAAVCAFVATNDGISVAFDPISSIEPAFAAERNSPRHVVPAVAAASVANMTVATATVANITLVSSPVAFEEDQFNSSLSKEGPLAITHEQDSNVTGRFPSPSWIASPRVQDSVNDVLAWFATLRLHRDAIRYAAAALSPTTSVFPTRVVSSEIVKVFNTTSIVSSLWLDASLRLFQDSYELVSTLWQDSSHIVAINITSTDVFSSPLWKEGPFAVTHEEVSNLTDLFPRSLLRTADADSNYNSTISIVSSLWLDASTGFWCFRELNRQPALSPGCSDTFLGFLLLLQGARRPLSLLYSSGRSGVQQLRDCLEAPLLLAFIRVLKAEDC